MSASSQGIGMGQTHGSARLGQLPRLRVRPAVAFVLVGCVAIGLLWFLYEKTQATSPKSRMAVQEQLRLVHQLDSDWNVDIMSSKIGLNDSYDPLVAPFQEISAALKRLESAEGGGEPAVRAQLEAMQAVFSRKADLVDEFKSHNSILRNSLRFLPTAASDAKAVIALRSPAAQAVGLTRDVNATLGEALRYAVVTDAAQREQLSLAMQQLHEAAGALADGSPEKESLTVFLNHTRTILKNITNEAGLLSGIVEVPTVTAIDVSGELFEGYFAREAGQSEQWRRALVGYSAVLLILAAFTADRLRKSYRQINTMNAALVEANDRLEQRVQERTQELKDALTSLRESEVQLIQSEKMSSLGQMIAGVAHEINTPLAYVRSSLETVSDRLGDIADLVRHSGSMLAALAAPEPDADTLSDSFAALSVLTSSFSDNAIPEELQKLASDSMYGLGQIHEIVVNLRNFSRLDRSKMTVFDLREGLESTLVIARSLMKGHRVVKQYAEIPKVQCAPSQLNQVFLNLITNAAQALPAEGGVITLTTSLEKKMVRVDVADNGRGIEPGHVQKVFDPFFTTKDIGQGTGLGLSIAYKIVQDHGGRIALQSELGRGTTFSIFLPTQRPATA